MLTVHAQAFPEISNTSKTPPAQSCTFTTLHCLTICVLLYFYLNTIELDWSSHSELCQHAPGTRCISQNRITPDFSQIRHALWSNAEPNQLFVQNTNVQCVTVWFMCTLDRGHTAVTWAFILPWQCSIRLIYLLGLCFGMQGAITPRIHGKTTDFALILFTSCALQRTD